MAPSSAAVAPSTLLLDKVTAAEILNVSARQLPRFVASGQLPPIRLGPRLDRFTPAELEASIARQSDGVPSFRMAPARASAARSAPAVGRPPRDEVSRSVMTKQKYARRGTGSAGERNGRREMRKLIEGQSHSFRAGTLGEAVALADGASRQTRLGAVSPTIRDWFVAWPTRKQTSLRAQTYFADEAPRVDVNGCQGARSNAANGRHDVQPSILASPYATTPSGRICAQSHWPGSELLCTISA